MVRERLNWVPWILCAVITLAGSASPLWADTAQSSEPHDFFGVVGKVARGRRVRSVPLA